MSNLVKGLRSLWYSDNIGDLKGRARTVKVKETGVTAEMGGEQTRR